VNGKDKTFLLYFCCSGAMAAHHWPRQSMCHWLEDNRLERWAQKHVMDPAERKEVHFVKPSPPRHQFSLQTNINEFSPPVCVLLGQAGLSVLEGNLSA
jgi:hypothetical protein